MKDLGPHGALMAQRCSASGGVPYSGIRGTAAAMKTAAAEAEASEAAAAKLLYDTRVTGWRTRGNVGTRNINNSPLLVGSKFNIYREEQIIALIAQK